MGTIKRLPLVEVHTLLRRAAGWAWRIFTTFLTVLAISNLPTLPPSVRHVEEFYQFSFIFISYVDLLLPRYPT